MSERLREKPPIGARVILITGSHGVIIGHPSKGSQWVTVLKDEVRGHPGRMPPVMIGWQHLRAEESTLDIVWSK